MLYTIRVNNAYNYTIITNLKIFKLYRLITQTIYCFESNLNGDLYNGVYNHRN